ncbi:MAG: 3-isopropylmalate dehydratase [Lawsonibacter sp.]|nr:3-isopropylmalate dehydratase [Lawsonibacter sp.]
MVFKGRVFRFEDDINTDYIISSKNKSKILDQKELAQHLMEDIRPDFFKEISPGDIIVAGENFGCGSSRETAPIVIKEAGIAAVVAKSFARIFYRNCINIGLPVVTCDTEGIREGQELTVDVAEGFVQAAGAPGLIKTAPYPAQVRELMEAGGMLEWLRAAGKIK